MGVFWSVFFVVVVHCDIFFPLVFSALVPTHGSVFVLVLLNLFLSIQKVDKPDV